MICALSIRAFSFQMTLHKQEVNNTICHYVLKSSMQLMTKSALKCIIKFESLHNKTKLQKITDFTEGCVGILWTAFCVMYLLSLFTVCICRTVLNDTLLYFTYSVTITINFTFQAQPSAAPVWVSFLQLLDRDERWLHSAETVQCRALPATVWDASASSDWTRSLRISQTNQKTWKNNTPNQNINV